MKSIVIILLIGGVFAISTYIPESSSALPQYINESGISTGINNGFGNVLGNESVLTITSDYVGNVLFSLKKGSGDFNDYAVMYLDTDNGLTGVNSTSELSDTSDQHRQAISGNGGEANLIFGSGFRANYAIAFDVNNYAGLWDIYSNTVTFPHIREVGIGYPLTTSTPYINFTFSMSDLGLITGDSFSYIITYISLVPNVFRSDEFHGVSTTTMPSGNPGTSEVTLGSDDYIVFTSAASVLPLIDVYSPLNNTLYNMNDIFFEYSTGGVVSMTIYLDDEANSTIIPESHTFMDLSEGEHNITIVATSTTENTTTFYYYFSIDSIAPNIAITTPNFDYSSTNDVSLTYTYDDAETVSVYLDNVANSTNIESGYVFAGLIDGEHNITITGDDGNGNIGKSTRIFTIDTLDPSVSIDQGIEFEVGTSGNTISFTGTDVNPTTYDLLLNGTSLSSDVWVSNQPVSWNLDSLSVGYHNFTVVVSDEAGHSAKATSIVHVTPVPEVPSSSSGTSTPSSSNPSTQSPPPSSNTPPSSSNNPSSSIDPSSNPPSDEGFLDASVSVMVVMLLGFYSLYLKRKKKL